MSKQFYKYLEKKLIKYLEGNEIKAGERFYLQLDENEQVKQFYDVLSECVVAKSFIYKHDKGGVYESFYLDLKGVRLVVASTVNVTDAYLVAVRNASGKQEKEWENTALLILSDTPNDSVKGGCLDLRKDGMPFSVTSISGSLKSEIESFELTQVDKAIIKFYIEQKFEDSYNTSLWDYEEILSIINKQKVEQEDYKKIGLFVDSGLEKENVRSMKKRLKENHDLYSKVDMYQEYENKEQQLEKLFDNKGVDKLKANNWQDTDYKLVKKSFEENKKTKALGYIEGPKSNDINASFFWERAKGDTAANRRKRQIIVFDKCESDILELVFEFDETLSKDFLDSKSKEYVNISGKKLKVRLPRYNEKNNFYKIVYNHKNENKSKHEFSIAVVNVDSVYLENIKTRYEIKTGSGGKNRIQINSDGNEIKLGYGLSNNIVDVENIDDIVNLGQNESVQISNTSQAWDDSSLKFRMNIEGSLIPFEIKEQGLRSKPINSTMLLKLKREFKKSFTWEDNKLIQDTREFYLEEKLKDILLKEKQIIEKELVYAVEGLTELEEKEITLSSNLKNAYLDIIKYYKKINNIPSLTYLNDELKELYTKFLLIYNNEIESIEEREVLANNEEKKNLLKVGTIQGEAKISFTPLAPINIAYSLELYKQLKNEVIDTHILDRLSSDNLIPYLYDDSNNLYKPSYQKNNIEWVLFEKREKVSVGETNAFVAKVIREKIEQFINNFSYLFPKHSKAPIKINVINIMNDKEVVKGIFDYMRNQIQKHASRIIPIDICIYNNGEESAFDNFFRFKLAEDIETEFGISLEMKEFDKLDVSRMLFENIRYYKKQNSDYEYAHISFYKDKDNDDVTKNNASDMESGLSLGGLLSTVTSNSDNEDYRLGFGTKNIINTDDLLVKIAININEFAINCESKCKNPYIKNTSIVTTPEVLNSEEQKALYNSAHWITFIEPSFGLEYFKESENSGVVVVHYSDQYSSTDQYDTITVTNKANQYKYIIKEFLACKNIEVIDEKLNDVIKSFNCINGEWLLNLIANKSEYDREKLSMIAAIKHGMALLNHEDIIWVPISMEEILRVSNAVKLDKSEGLFSVKNNKKKGIHSDDLMFIGLNIADKNNLEIYYYPVEVKIGYNFASTVNKGMAQVDKTFELIKEQLSKDTKDLFKHKFFRNFFIKLFISNAQKFVINNIWPEKNMERITNLKKYLLNDEYEVSFNLCEEIGKGALISFKKDNHWRSIKKEEDILVIELTEDDAYRDIVTSINDLYENIKVGKSDMNIEDLLYSKNISMINKVENKDIVESSEVEILQPVGMSSNIELEIKQSCATEDTQSNLKEVKNSDNNLEGIKILLGQAEGTTKNIYWEYGHKELTNRHMVITGKSGNGKTYFIQCALKELIDNGIPAIIIDYTDGFKKSQLEDEFKDALGDKIEQFIVAANKFPLNIFKKGIKQLDEDIYIDEDNSDVAERFKSVIGAVYKDLGIQQLNAIYQTVMDSLTKYDGKLNLRAFRNELEENSSTPAQTALAQLNVLLDKNPFDESKDFDWGDIHKDGGKLFIIQLTGYTKDIQKVITEMILWNLYMYKAQHGNKNLPFAVILDEAQNLNFGENAPSTKILTEGRKFGWSAWIATQFLKGQMDKATISRLQNSAEKIYFAQTEEEATSVANAFGQTPDEKKVWIRELINLEKGSCVVHGPIEDQNGKLVSIKPTKIKITSLNDRK